MADEGGDARPATIYDVAAAAGVSASTVSRTFSRPGRVSSRTAQAVRSAAERLGYRSEEIYRPAPLRKNWTIGLAVADVTNPGFFPIIRGAETAATEAGYTLMMIDAQESGQVERQMFARALPLIGGLVIAGPRLSDTDLRGLARSVPVVVLNRVVTGLGSVVSDNARGVELAVQHLVSLGHRRIGYVAGPEASWADGSRWRAVRSVSRESGVTATRIGPFTPTVGGGREAARAVCQRQVTACVVYNDLMAMGLIDEFRGLGVAVPQELSLVSFDNIFASDLITPPLTTVATPLAALGATGVRHLVSQAGRSAPAPEQPMVLPVRLVVRGSTGPVRA